MGTAADDAWKRRTITLVGDRRAIDQHCADWVAVGWQIEAVTELAERVGSQPCHTVTVRVPPLNWSGHAVPLVGGENADATSVAATA